uniref:Uncharacterized protein n=1 Tax=Eptatretus burgeri TaxID=7764 RepID=A0A8C4RA35_EPTBU
MSVDFPDNYFLIQLARFDDVNMLQQHASAKCCTLEKHTAFEKDVEASTKKSVSSKLLKNTGSSKMNFDSSGSNHSNRRQNYSHLVMARHKEATKKKPLLETEKKNEEMDIKHPFLTRMEDQSCSDKKDVDSVKEEQQSSRNSPNSSTLEVDQHLTRVAGQMVLQPKECSLQTKLEDLSCSAEKGEHQTDVDSAKQEHQSCNQIPGCSLMEFGENKEQQSSSQSSDCSLMEFFECKGHQSSSQSQSCSPMEFFECKEHQSSSESPSCSPMELGEKKEHQSSSQSPSCSPMEFFECKEHQSSSESPSCSPMELGEKKEHQSSSQSPSCSPMEVDEKKEQQSSSQIPSCSPMEFFECKEHQSSSESPSCSPMELGEKKEHQSSSQIPSCSPMEVDEKKEQQSSSQIPSCSPMEFGEKKEHQSSSQSPGCSPMEVAENKEQQSSCQRPGCSLMELGEKDQQSSSQIPGCSPMEFGEKKDHPSSSQISGCSPMEFGEKKDQQSSSQIPGCSPMEFGEKKDQQSRSQISGCSAMEFGQRLATVAEQMVLHPKESTMDRESTEDELHNYKEDTTKNDSDLVKVIYLENVEPEAPLENQNSGLLESHVNSAKLEQSSSSSSIPKGFRQAINFFAKLGKCYSKSSSDNERNDTTVDSKVNTGKGKLRKKRSFLNGLRTKMSKVLTKCPSSSDKEAMSD